MFTVDVEGDGANELFIVWTFSTGVGHDGAVEQTEICGRRWAREGPVYLAALSGELAALHLYEQEAIDALLSAQRAADGACRGGRARRGPRRG